MKLNRQVLKQILEIGESLQRAVNRCTGKTTAAIFEAIAKSYSSFGTEVKIHDPDVPDMNEERKCTLYYQTIDVLRINKLQPAIQVRNKYNGVYLINTFAEEIV